MKKWIIGGFALLAVIGALSGSGSNSSSSIPSDDSAVARTAENTSQDSQSENPAAQAKPAADKQPEMTTSQKNAVESAKNYLDFKAFSKKGLIRQLSSSAGEGFPKADARFAVNHIQVDWNKQAAKSARDYLDMGSFSQSRLIEQLSSSAGEGFTRAQAEYAVSKVY